MAFQVTANQMAQVAPRVPAASLSPLADAINATLSRFKIDQAERRVRYFVAQTAYETTNYTAWEEDLTYTTPERLVEVWPSRFTMDPTHTAYAYAPDYINNPQKLGNLVYANQYGNGDAASGDGYNYRGQGGIHLTFKSNYALASKSLWGDSSVLLDTPQSLQQYANGMLVAGWFWDTRSLNAQADADAFTKTTQIINGATGQALIDLVAERLVTLNAVNTILQW